VARFEFLSNVKRWEFLLLTLGLPIFVSVLMVLTAVPNMLYMQHKLSTAKDTEVGWVDPQSRFTFPDTVKTQPPPAVTPSGSGVDLLGTVTELAGPATFHFKKYANVEQAKKDLLAGSLDFLYVFHEDYLSSGLVDELTVDRGLLSTTRTPPLRALLQKQLIGNKLAADVLPRVIEPLNRVKIMLTPEGKVVADETQQEISQFFLPYGMMIMLMMSLLGSSTYLLRSLSEEKENRIMEILLAAVTPGTLFYGKILGLGLLGLAQVGVWLILVLPVIGMLVNYLHITLASLAFFLIYFALGYTLFAGLIAGVGAVGSTEKESNQLLGFFFFLAILPMTVMPIILDDLNGVVARAFSFFPFTAPMVMMVRMVKESPPVMDVVISLLSLVAGIWIVYRLALKVFRMGLLMYGKTPGLREIWTWIRM
jgi:ABC-2 type transport system permease protein